MPKKVQAQASVPTENMPEEQSGMSQVRDVYCLFVNDAVDLNTKVPLGNWYVVFLNFSSPAFDGPYPLTAPTRGGEKPYSGYVSTDTLRNVGEFLYQRLVERGFDSVPTVQLDLVSGSNKMMSLWISSSN